MLTMSIVHVYLLTSSPSCGGHIMTFLSNPNRLTCIPRVARKFLEKYKRIDTAIDSYYNNPNQFGGVSSRNSDSERATKLSALFEKYKGMDKLC